MKISRSNSLLRALRRDNLRGLWLAIFVLLVPFFQPLAEAKAAPKPFAGEICSTFGQKGSATSPALADDCPMCIGGTAVPSLAADPSSNVTNLKALFFALAPAVFSYPLIRLGTARNQWMMPPGQGPPSDI